MPIFKKFTNTSLVFLQLNLPSCQTCKNQFILHCTIVKFIKLGFFICVEPIVQILKLGCWKHWIKKWSEVQAKFTSRILLMKRLALFWLCSQLKWSTLQCQVSWIHAHMPCQHVYPCKWACKYPCMILVKELVIHDKYHYYNML